MTPCTDQTEEQTHPPRWEDIDWPAVEGAVRRIQERIYRATEREDWHQVRSLQKLLVRATATKLLAIRRVTQENQGKNTPGVDGVVCATPAARMQLLQDGLNLTDYRPKPVRRVYIPKPDGRRRPLGIPTVTDRVRQAMVKAALEPEWEARFEANSYGFRPGRCTMDAIEALHTTMSRKGASQWVLDADISGCFDTIAHDVLLAKIPVFTTTIRRWLKAGVVELGHYTATDAGTPQGGVASPLLANIALDGMERLFGSETAEGKPVLPSRRKGLNRGVSLIRYADDFVVVAPSREVLETYVLPKLTTFLAERGLRLSEAKTRIVHVTAGFNFLGFQIRRYNNKLLTKPQKEKVLQHLHSTKVYLRANQQAPAGRIIRDLNPKIRGWCNYYRHCAAKQTFGYVQHRTWQMLWRWAKRRHPNKPSKWVRKRYFKDDGWWAFHAKNAELAKYPATPVTRYVKVSGRSSPFDPTLRAYWETRKKRLVGWQIVSKRLLALLRRQDYRCAKCGMAFEPDDLDGSLHMHHKVQRDVGGADDLDNLEVVHSWCHHQHHQRCGYRSRCAKAQAV